MDNARMHLPGAVDDALKLELRNTISEFLDETNAWQEDISFVTASNRVAYDLISVEPAAINRLLHVKHSGGGNVTATMAEPGVVVLRSEPNADEKMTATVALTVDDPTDRNAYPVFPAWILTKWEAPILEGLLARMFAHPAKPYSNERLGVYHARKFRAALAAARHEVVRTNLYGAQAWRFPRNFM